MPNIKQHQQLTIMF